MSSMVDANLVPVLNRALVYGCRRVMRPHGVPFRPHKCVHYLLYRFSISMQ